MQGPPAPGLCPLNPLIRLSRLIHSMRSLETLALRHEPLKLQCHLSRWTMSDGYMESMVRPTKVLLRRLTLRSP